MWTCVLAVAVFSVGTHGFVRMTSGMKSFSSVIKAGAIQANVEKLLYERNTGQPGVIAEQWYTGKYRIKHAHIYRIDGHVRVEMFLRSHSWLYTRTRLHVRTHLGCKLHNL